jgi:hypothetical protein
MKDKYGESWNAEVHTVNYWNDMSERVRHILAERPNVAAYANDELFSQWVRNLTPGPGTKFKDLPDDWVCPSCGSEKWRFSPED